MERQEKITNQKYRLKIANRLGNRLKNNELTTFIDLLKVWVFNIGVLGSGSGQVTQTTFDENKIIELNVDGLSLLKFDPDPATFQKVFNKNYEIVNNYFIKQPSL